MALIDRVDETGPPPRSTQWMNPTRSLAIIAVIAIHTIADTVGLRFADHGSGPWWAANLIDSASRWSVPVFLMIAGALALDPTKGGRPRDFLSKRFWRIGVPLVAWTAIYIPYRLFVMAGRETGWDPVTAILTGSPFVQLYFLYVLALLTLLTPFMRQLTVHGSRRAQWGTALVLLGIGMVDHFASVLAGVGEPNIATRFLPLMGYYLLGWILRDHLVRGRAFVWAVVGFVGSIAFTALWAGWGPGDRPWVIVYEYMAPTVVVMSLTGYLVLHRVFANDFRPYLGLRRLFPYSFGVFLLHPLLVYSLRKVIGVPDSVTAVLFHGLVLPLVYALVCAVVTKIALRTPVVRIAFGEVPVGVAAPVQLRAAVPVEDAGPASDEGPTEADDVDGAAAGGR
ncbi:acyltransferase [Brevibacterium yomogidense]|uniref:acyltransferase n=1 Tax=Brevibacterium yomogidense TaxID=946573 RepID=UPI0018DFE45E|nr:acyltransferase family protein [Brevibacterium yomogidense]